MRAFLDCFRAADRRALCLAATLAVALPCGSPAAAQTQGEGASGPLAMRSGPVNAGDVPGQLSVSTAGGYARLVFQMAEALDAEAQISGNILIIGFSRPVAVPLDALGAARDYLSVSRRDPDGTGIRIALTRKLRLNRQMAGERIYIDLLPADWTGPLPSLPQEVVEELARRAREAERKLRALEPAAPPVPTVRVKVGVQPTFTRYVFGLPRGVPVSTERTADMLTLKFGTPISFDLGDTRDSLPAMVASIDSELDKSHAAVSFRFGKPAEIRTFREDQAYIVDVSAPQQTDAKDKSAKDASTKDSSAEDKGAKDQADKSAAARDGTAREKAPPAGLKAPETVPAAGAPRAARQPAPLAPNENPRVDADAAPAKSDVAAAAAKPEPTPAPTPAPAAAPSVAAAAADRPQDASASRPQAAMPSTAAAPSFVAASPDGALKVAMRRQDEAVTLAFPFAAATPAAAFRRADTVWLVFDTTRAIDLSALQAVEPGSEPVFRDAILTRPAPGLAVVRLKLDRPRLTALVPQAQGWLMTLGDRSAAASPAIISPANTPSHDLVVARNVANPQRAAIIVPFDASRAVHRLVDPDLHDELLVTTALGPPRGVARLQSFVDLTMLPTMHGVVARPLADDVTAEIDAGRVVLSRPGGLTLSNAVNPATAALSRSAPLDTQVWGFDQQADFRTRQTELIARAAASSADKRLSARLDLARFYLARDMYPEAKAVLDVVLAGDGSSSDDAGALVLRAIANVMLNRPAAALRDLADPLIGKQYDAPVWRAVARADQGHFADAREGFRDAQVMVASLPVELQRFALRQSARSSIALQDFAGAQRQLNEFETIGVPARFEPTLAVLNGRVAEGLGQPTEALRQYRIATDSDDRIAAAQGRLRELVMRHAKGEISRPDMIAALETLTAVWRGDETESEGQLLLAQLYTQDARYRDAFRVMRAALLAHPNSATTRKIHDDAATTFESLFLAGGSDAMPPVEALGLFYDYRELTPIGRRGDEMIRRLAERLAAVDLLDQAAELLQHQVDHRLQGAARAQVATRLAVIYLMNRKPDRALAALRTTRTGDLSNELRAQRLLLEARALADRGRGPLALEIIEKDASREATRLRADILWQAKDWSAAAGQFEKLYGNRWKDFAPLTAAERADILRAAVGYALTDDAIDLARLRERYAAKMADGPERDAFDLVTGPAGAANVQFPTIASNVGSYDALDGLLRLMRERYPETGAISRPVSLAPERQAALPPRARVAAGTTGSIARR